MMKAPHLFGPAGAIVGAITARGVYEKVDQIALRDPDRAGR